MSGEAVRDYLESMGFNPWKQTLKLRVDNLIYDHQTGTAISKLSRDHGVSRYIVEKIIREFEHAEIT